MKRVMVLVLLLAVSVKANASGNFTVYTGYQMPLLIDAGLALTWVYNSYPTRIDFHNSQGGITAGIEGAYWYYSWWGVGGRVSFTGLFEGVAEGIDGGIPVKTTIGGSFFQLSAGIPLLFEFFDGKMSLGGGIYAGWGLASLDYDRSGYTAWSLNADGQCFVIEIPARIAWHISSSFLLELNMSLKSAKAADMRAREDSLQVDGVDYHKGEKIAFDMDFSGIMIGVGFNWRYSSHDWPWYEKKWSWTE